MPRHREISPSQRAVLILLYRKAGYWASRREVEKAANSDRPDRARQTIDALIDRRFIGWRLMGRDDFLELTEHGRSVAHRLANPPVRHYRQV